MTDKEVADIAREQVRSAVQGITWQLTNVADEFYRAGKVDANVRWLLSEIAARIQREYVIDRNVEP